MEDLKKYVGKIVYDKHNKIVYYAESISPYTPNTLICEVLMDFKKIQIKGKRFSVHYTQLKIINNHLFLQIRDLSKIIQYYDEKSFEKIINNEFNIFNKFAQNLKRIKNIMIEEMNVRETDYYKLWNDLYKDYDTYGL